MTTKAPNRKQAIKAINEARVIVKHTLSTIGFKGDAVRLVIEEVQFALCPAAVTLDHGGKNLSNVVEEHEKLLRERKRYPSQDESETGSEGGTTYRRLNFAPLRDDDIRDDDSTPLLLGCLKGVERADEFAFGGSVLTIYYRGIGKEGPRPGDSGNEKLRKAVERFLQACDKYLAKAAARLPQSGAVAASDDKGLLLKDIFPKLASESSYLKLVLGELRDQILLQLKEVDETHFGELSENTFALQFFMRLDTATDEGSPLPKKPLRYFPLDKEIDALRARVRQPTGGEELSDEEFIRQYPWTARQSLIGYTFKAEAGRFFGEWQLEAIASGKELSGKEQEDRTRATRIMDSIRGVTNHQFNIPLFAHGQIFGAIIINTRDWINWRAQRIPVRCARQVGSMIESARRMDPKVNQMTRRIAEAEAKAAGVRVYRHMLSAMLHEEVYYLALLDAVYDSVYKNKGGSTSEWKERFQYVRHDRKQLLNEFNNPKEPDSDAPIRSVDGSAIYHGGPDLDDTKLDDLKKWVWSLRKLFNIQEKLTVSWPSRDLTPTIPQLKTEVLLRVLGNLLRNTNSRAERVEAPSLDFKFGTLERDGRLFLQIVAKDNCGGFRFDKGFPRGKIDFAKWDAYLKRLEEQSRPPGGMGFLTMLKYTTSTGGELHVDNHRDERGVIGACVTLLMGLKKRRAAA